MNAAVKDRWLAALGSGDYLQGTGQLKLQSGDDVHHCCLGVLSEVYTEEFPETMWRCRPEWLSPGHITWGMENCEDVGYWLPNDRVLKWAGINAVTAALLAEKNDAATDFKPAIKFIQEEL